MASPIETHDIIILGAGLSGINAAHMLRTQMPHRKLTMLEARPVLGGTWTFFRYPGFRSDSHMSTFGLPWHPWPHAHKVASGPEIAAYLEDAARTDGSYQKIRFRHRMVGCEWHSEEQQWTLEVDADGKRKTLKANFVVSCTGYYSYDKAFPVNIPGLETFGGQVAHPQWWPKDLDWSGKRVVVVGSGATMVTLLPNLAEKAGRVTVLQRSPSYVAAMPTRSKVDDVLRMLLPALWFHLLLRWRDSIGELLLTQFLLAFPAIGRFAITRRAKKELPQHIDVDTHFNPAYNPLQQRPCLCPDGDFFKALHRENCEVVTDVIETVTPSGILLKSGRQLEADLIITATGLYFELLGGVTLVVDGRPIAAGEHFAWRGCMLDSVPNMVFVMGYSTSTWTPGADATTRLALRVVQHMERRGATSVTPTMQRREQAPRRLAVDATSSYFVKAADRMPKVTGSGPWYGRVSLAKDWWALWFASMEDGLVYGRHGKAKPA
ncbi:hypothetical protein S40285_01066 [Stachybotrys chlorohalonatus IBT 40285]|uniref:FAD/NAD(P)-binding domain-containing protein n=1 Tax=Stachybotrys chlorohalonatus (strain IBT 40285) TaxID=1283841 RepID=A0A084QKF9_STAC4|nr:hypothetical protein S40285_01066 [Stachybotrys chlorohalonata IBT 40285]